jgi:hypothetical protein
VTDEHNESKTHAVRQPRRPNMPFDPQTNAWLSAENVAVSAELKAEKAAEAGTDPGMPDMFLEAKELRKKADELFLMLHPPLGEEPDT